MKTYLESKEVDRIEQAAECLRDKLLVRLLSHLGCRVSETLGISVDDIDFDQGTVTIIHLKRRIKLSCPECKAKLSRTTKFCPGCGSMVEQAVINERDHSSFVLVCLKRLKRDRPMGEIRASLCRTPAVQSSTHSQYVESYWQTPSVNDREASS